MRRFIGLLVTLVAFNAECDKPKQLKLLPWPIPNISSYKVQACRDTKTEYDYDWPQNNVTFEFESSLATQFDQTKYLGDCFVHGTWSNVRQPKYEGYWPKNRQAVLTDPIWKMHSEVDGTLGTYGKIKLVYQGLYDANEPESGDHKIQLSTEMGAMKMEYNGDGSLKKSSHVIHLQYPIDEQNTAELEYTFSHRITGTLVNFSHDLTRFESGSSTNSSKRSRYEILFKIMELEASKIDLSKLMAKRTVSAVKKFAESAIGELLNLQADVRVEAAHTTSTENPFKISLDNDKNPLYLKPKPSPSSKSTEATPWLHTIYSIAFRRDEEQCTVIRSRRSSDEFADPFFNDSGMSDDLNDVKDEMQSSEYSGSGGDDAPTTVAFTTEMVPTAKTSTIMDTDDQLNRAVNEVPFDIVLNDSSKLIAFIVEILEPYSQPKCRIQVSLSTNNATFDRKPEKTLLRQVTLLMTAQEKGYDLNLISKSPASKRQLLHNVFVQTSTQDLVIFSWRNSRQKNRQTVLKVPTYQKMMYLKSHYEMQLQWTQHLQPSDLCFLDILNETLTTDDMDLSYGFYQSGLSIETPFWEANMNNLMAMKLDKNSIEDGFRYLIASKMNTFARAAHAILGELGTLTKTFREWVKQILSEESGTTVEKYIEKTFKETTAGKVSK